MLCLEMGPGGSLLLGRAGSPGTPIHVVWGHAWRGPNLLGARVCSVPIISLIATSRPLKMHQCLRGKNFRRSGKFITLSSLIRRKGGFFSPHLPQTEAKRGYFCLVTPPWDCCKVRAGGAQTWVRRTQLPLQRRENSAHPTQAGGMGTSGLQQLSPPQMKGQQLSLPCAENTCWEHIAITSDAGTPGRCKGSLLPKRIFIAQNHFIAKNLAFLSS